MNQSVEDLPDELFLYIFTFLQPKDLFNGWYNLNYRINTIVCSTHIHITIKDNDDFNGFLPYFKHFSSQITHLKDERFFPNPKIDLCSLPNIQFLYLTQCSNEQLQNIHPNNQSYLTHCFLLSATWQFYERILFGQPRFPHLMSIGCPRSGSIYLLNVTHATNKIIRRLHLQSASPEILYKFIEYLPCITSLIINYFYENNSSSPTLFTNSKIHRLTIVHPLSSQLCFDQLLSSVGFPELIYLRITFGMCDFQELACILTKFSRLKHFILQVNTFTPDFNLNATRLISSWFTSLNYKRFVNKSKDEQAVLISNTQIY
ncbi:hypothetical protein I4U23_023281 [Adineta vaga]|nr:hypothetical protein I4U23_023281 [Adineta vaga]